MLLFFYVPVCYQYFSHLVVTLLHFLSSIHILGNPAFRIQRRLSNVGERGKKFGNVFLAFSRTLGNRNGLFHKEKRKFYMSSLFWRKLVSWNRKKSCSSSSENGYLLPLKLRNRNQSPPHEILETILDTFPRVL